MARFVGIDLGTSAVRAVAIGEDGSERAALRRELGEVTATGQDDGTDPDAWARAVRELLSSVGPCDAFAIAGQMNGYVAVDENGVALGQALGWQDRRLIAPEQAGGGHEAPVVRFAHHLREHEPDTWRRTRWLLLPKDYVLLSLTGVVISDHLSWNSVADPATGAVRPGLPSEVADRLPPRAAITARQPSDWGEAILGCPDTIGALIACGIDSASAFLVGGTSQTVAAFAEDPSPTHGIRAAVPLDDSWLHVGSSSVGGATLRWAVEALAFDDVPDLIVAAGYADLRRAPFFVPYLSGERAPIWDGSATGSWRQLRSDHGRSELAYSVLESVVFATRSLLDAVLTSARRPVAAVRATGGPLRVAAVRALCARTFGYPIEFVPGDTGAVGAAALALAACHELTVGDASAAVKGEAEHVAPVEDGTLAERHDRWRELDRH